MAEVAHGRAQRLRGEHGAQHAPDPMPRADITCGTRSLAPGIHIREYLLDEREVGPRAVPGPADEANSRLPCRHHGLLRAGWVRPHDLVTGDANLGRFLQGGCGHDAAGAQDDPVGLGDFHPQPGRLLVQPRRLHGQVLHRKAILGGLGVEEGHGFPARGVIGVDMRNFQALELLHAADALADEPDLGRVLTPPGDRGGEDIRKHPPIRSVRAPNAHREQGDLVVRGPLRQGIGERGGEQRKHRRPRGPLAFQALVALYAAGDVVDGFALFPDQFHAVDAAIARIEEGQIVDEAIGHAVSS